MGKMEENWGEWELRIHWIHPPRFTIIILLLFTIDDEIDTTDYSLRSQTKQEENGGTFNNIKKNFFARTVRPVRDFHIHARTHTHFPNCIHWFIIIIIDSYAFTFYTLRRVNLFIQSCIVHCTWYMTYIASNHRIMDMDWCEIMMKWKTLIFHLHSVFFEKRSAIIIPISLVSSSRVYFV